MKDNPDLATAIDILDAWIERTMFKNHQPGLAIGLVYDDQLFWGKGYGYANVETKQPVTLDTRFRIASITKTFTATAIMQLRDAGKLSLDDPASKYLRWFDLRYEGAPEITIRNLLTHSSGLPRDSHNAMWTDCDAPDWDEFVKETLKRKPTRPPYDKDAYSNLAYSLLGGIIAEVSGQSWADYLQQNILDPLKMSETYPVPKRDDPLLATGYSQLNDAYERSPMPFFLMNGFEASANFASSVNDLAKYASYHLSKDSNPILSHHTLRDMHRMHWLKDGWEEGYGLGIMIYKVNDWVITGHGGGYPGYLTGFSVCRDHKVGLILLTNALGSMPLNYIKQAYKIVMPEIVKAIAKAEPTAEPAWDKYLGEYVGEWGFDKVVIRGGQLQIISLDFIDSPATTLEATDDEHVFILQEEGQSNETARFELDESGNVIKMWTRNEYLIKKS